MCGLKPAPASGKQGVVAGREGGFQKKLAAVTVRLAALGSFAFGSG
jgi:hypothetical protein